MIDLYASKGAELILFGPRFDNDGMPEHKRIVFPAGSVVRVGMRTYVLQRGERKTIGPCDLTYELISSYGGAGT